MDRLLALAEPAAQQALASLPQASYLPVWLGISPTRPGWSADTGWQLADKLSPKQGRRWDRAGCRLIVGGHAAVLLGIKQAAELITDHGADFALVGGVDSYHPTETLAWLDARSRLLSAANPDGFIPGEGAGFCLLAAADVALRHGLRPLAEVVSCAAAEEPYPLDSAGVCTGTGLTQALSQALACGHRADWTICDLNGESFRAQEWAYAYLRTAHSHGEPLQVWHPADCTGDTGAASGAILLAVACAALNRGYARGVRPLLFTSADHGPRAALMLAPPSRY